MSRPEKVRILVCAVCLGAALILSNQSALGQVDPSDVKSPTLKEAEQKYLPQLRSLHKAISEASFPFPFLLSRYVTANPDRPNFDSRGLEFVIFQGQTILKTSGIYRAAYDGDKLSQNERAARTFQDVIVPLLRLIGQQIPRDVACDSIGFEIAYHTRAPNKSYEYEGKEILVVVLSREDAFAFSDKTDDQRQAILNQSSVFVNGKEYGLALHGRNAVDLEALGRSGAGGTQGTSPSSPMTGSRLAVVNPTPSPASPAPAAVAPAPPPPEPKPAPTRADVERLQSRYQPQLDALAKESGAQFHLVEYAPPAFAIYHERLVLQLTLRNPLSFEKTSSSIYKRAAQSIDLFLAPELKALLQKIPADAEFDALDFSLLNRLGAEKSSSEAVEFVCPLKAVRSFANDEITSQELVNQSIVLVNGVRISLNLQLVE